MPAALAACDIGVAPFDVSRHRPLELDFYWSPLKIFEYMASGLPVVAPRIPRLAHLIEDGREGRLYDATDPAALAATLLALHKEPAVRAALGNAARARAVADYSWRTHCERLSGAFEALVRKQA
jgi:glycosyltransferase involved in cell wall biosynthesis